jgi:hypothetical protein
LFLDLAKESQRNDPYLMNDQDTGCSLMKGRVEVITHSDC